MMSKIIPARHLPPSIAPGAILMVPAPNEDMLDITISEVNWQLPGIGLDEVKHSAHYTLICDCQIDELNLPDYEQYLELYGFESTDWVPYKDGSNVVDLTGGKE
jgi:hypothetical protein